MERPVPPGRRGSNGSFKDSDEVTPSEHLRMLRERAKGGKGIEDDADGFVEQPQPQGGADEQASTVLQRRRAADEKRHQREAFLSDLDSFATNFSLANAPSSAPPPLPSPLPPSSSSSFSAPEAASSDVERANPSAGPLLSGSDTVSPAPRPALPSSPGLGPAPASQSGLSFSAEPSEQFSGLFA